MLSLINPLLSPKNFFYLSRKIEPFLYVLFIMSLGYGLIDGLFLVPPDYIQGDGFRIIYIHVPSAFLSLFIYSIMALAALLGTIFRLKLCFLIMKHSAPIGAIFTLLALVTGSLWGKPMWGTWWIWDARLTSQFILLFLYLGIILFQSAIAHKKNNERISAILVMVGFIDIPIIHYSVYWWNTLHQGATLKILEPSRIAPVMLYPLLAMIFSFMIYYTIVLFLRINYDLIHNQAKFHWL
jgi:heme exporter protein C